MKALEEIKVSVYENVYSKKPQVMSFHDVIVMCIHPVYASPINTIRRYHAEGNQDAAQKLKSRLPCFTPAGTFGGAHAIRNFLHHSHIVGLDYDHVPHREEIIRRCAADPHTVAALESPTDGVKVFAYVENIEGHHREGVQWVSGYYNRLLGLDSDPACKDESRLCYFTYSPHGYVAGLYEPFVLREPGGGKESRCEEDTGYGLRDSNATGEKKEFEKKEAHEKESERNRSDEKSSHEKGLKENGNNEEKRDEKEVSESEIKQFFSSYIFFHPLTAGQRNTNLFKLACEACRRHYPQESILRELTAYFEHTDFSYGEINSVLSSGYKTVAEQSPATAPSAGRSPQKDIKTKGQYDPNECPDDADESYWTGEELRKSTPTLPDGVYDNLPELLNACLIEEGSRREQDISFLSVLTALSAALPATFGIYNHKRYSTHLYSVVFSPAGSGKSIAQTGRYLLEEIQEQILTASENSLQAYNTRHSEWQRECAVKKKNGDPCPEEPQRPPFKMLIIPATTSYTRMQIQMQDNGPQGSIIFDTEAQTLATANHLDCGNFDDMLRKAFEHENIDSSYKANGIRPIYVRHPKLALFLTGTPGQIDALLNNYENGLPSRILFYTFRELPHWKEMGDDSFSLEDSFRPIAHRVYELYTFCERNPVVFHMTRSQWHRLNTIFSRLLTEVATEGNDDLQAVVKRYAFLVMRISMIQTRIRQFDTGLPQLDIYCTDDDFERSLQIVLCCYEHSRLLLSSLPAHTARPLKNPDTVRHFVSELPDTFSTEEAVRLGAEFGFSHRKVTRLLKSLNGVKISKLSHGVYSKTN